MRAAVNALHGTVLVVDDDKSILRILRIHLEEAGYQVILTSGGKSILEELDSLTFDLIICDIKMPEVDGARILEHVVEKFSDIPIIMLTAFADLENAMDSMRKGAFDYLTKPVKKETLTLTVHKAVAHRNLLAENRRLAQANMEYRAGLEKKVRERTEELEETRFEIIRRLVIAADKRDINSGFHIARVSKMCRMLAQQAGLDGELAHLIEQSCPIHDIGKIGIPDRVLFKAGRYTPFEREIMKTHTVIGGQMLEGHSSILLQTARSIALTHHEHWDGSGYPEGLRGEETPMGGRIVAIIDVFDALTSARPYREAWDMDDAIAEINRASGSQFDPALVEHFNKIMPDIRSIMNSSPGGGAEP